MRFRKSFRCLCLPCLGISPFTRFQAIREKVRERTFSVLQYNASIEHFMLDYKRKLCYSLAIIVIFKSMNEAHCKECGSVFKQRRHWHKFCCVACRTTHYVRQRNEDAIIGRQMRQQATDQEPTSIKRDLFSSIAA